MQDTALKNHKKTWGVLCVVTLMLSACGGGDPSPTVKAMQRKDKSLSCKEVLLEMNEADFYKQTAYKNKGPKLKNVLMPLGYVSTYMNAEEAIGAADARIAYLDRIYEILRCEKKDKLDEEDMPSYPGEESSMRDEDSRKDKRSYSEYQGMRYYSPYN